MPILRVAPSMTGEARMGHVSSPRNHLPFNYLIGLPPVWIFCIFARPNKYELDGIQITLSSQRATICEHFPELCWTNTRKWLVATTFDNDALRHSLSRNRNGHWNIQLSRSKISKLFSSSPGLLFFMFLTEVRVLRSSIIRVVAVFFITMREIRSFAKAL